MTQKWHKNLYKAKSPKVTRNLKNEWKFLFNLNHEIFIIKPQKLSRNVETLLKQLIQHSEFQILSIL